MRIRILVALMAIVAGPGVVDRVHAQGDPNDAAHLYESAFEAYFAMPEADWDPIWAYYPDPSAEPPEGLRTVLARAKPILATLKRATSKRRVDWGLDYEEGFEMLLPHLAPMRGLARLQRVQVILDLHDGRAVDAAEGIATLYRLAAHARTDRTLISSLVAQAVYALADQTAQIGLDHGVFEGASADRLVRGHRTLEQDDPFWVVEAIAMEQELSASWLESRFGTEEARAEADTVEWLDLDDERYDAFASMTDEEFADELVEYDAIMDAMAAAFVDPDSEAGLAELSAIEEQAEAGAFGLIATTLMPAFSRVLARTQEMEETLEARAELYRGLALGSEAAADHANAVPYYVRAVEKLDEIGAAALPALRARDRDPRVTLAPEEADALTALLDRSGEVLDLVREGTSRQRCDFEYLHRRYRTRVCPPYVAGLRDVVRLLHARTRRARSADDRSAVVDHLELAYRFIAHLSRDNHFLLAATAHDAYRTNRTLAEPLLTNLAPDAPERVRLFRAADAIGRSDPFGYLAAKKQLEISVGSLPYFWGRRQGGDETLNQAIATFEQEAMELWSLDELVFVSIVFDAAVRQDLVTDKDERDFVRLAKPGDLVRVSDLIDATQMAAIVAEAPAVHERLRARDARLFQGRVIPLPVQLELRRSTARSDLRAGIAALRPRSLRGEPGE